MQLPASARLAQRWSECQLQCQCSLTLQAVVAADEAVAATEEASAEGAEVIGVAASVDEAVDPCEEGWEEEWGKYGQAEAASSYLTSDRH